MERERYLITLADGYQTQAKTMENALKAMLHEILSSNNTSARIERHGKTLLRFDLNGLPEEKA
jgi:DNA-binding TFAR19-related protein (PDSD5 family)